MYGTLLNDIVIIFILAVAVLYLFNRLRIPSIVGFLITGILAGPHGLALVTSVDQVEVIAEVGVIFLLFSIGMEFSFKELMEIRKTVLLGGAVQVTLCILLSTIIAMGLKMSWQSAVFIGCLVSLSSTAIVLKQLGERAE
ncbi:MAG TPA: potassium transporter KefB, partial [Syntrophomonas sp.]|nr:potassium transporter KefB [Syntrophomonas sp.]